MSVASLHLLVVDDHAAQRQLMVRMLRSLGVTEVVEASSGEEALACLALSVIPFDAVLSDLDMPSGDGLDLALGVRRRRPGLPVTLMSAINPHILGGIESLRDEGSHLVEQVLRKPVSLGALRDWLGSLQARRPVLRPEEPPLALHAVANAVRAGQIRPWFEPQVDLASGALTGFEALARWEHPERGLIPPARFIPVAEGTPVLTELTLSMLDQSARLLRGLQWQDRPLHLSLNMGMVCLEDESFTARACESVQRLDLPPDRVTLEVTESASMDDAEAVVTSLARLRMRGFDLAVDDFGTGFASLRQFTYGAYSEVKIDRQFVARMGEDRTARAAVLSIAALARGLDMRCVAEGIETAAVREHALRAGCTVGQGWLWSRPIRGADLAAWTAAFQPLA